MVFTYYIKLLGTGADTHSGILMSLLLLVAETMTQFHRKMRQLLPDVMLIIKYFGTLYYYYKSYEIIQVNFTCYKAFLYIPLIVKGCCYKFFET